MTKDGTNLEEESDNKDLKTAHGDDESNLNHAEVDNAVLSAANGSKVTVFTSSEVFLVSRDGGELARDLEDGLLEDGGLLGGGALLRGELSAGFVLDLSNKLVERIQSWRKQY